MMTEPSWLYYQTVQRTHSSAFMTSIRKAAYRRAIALWLLGSLAVGLASPALAARTRGTTSIYAQWLEDRMGDVADARVQGVMDRLARSGFPTLRAYVVTFVHDLVFEHGLAEAALVLDEESPSSTGGLTRDFLARLRSLSAERLPASALMPESDGRALPLDRWTLCSPRVEDASDAPVLSATSTSVFVDVILPSCRPATGGAQPRGP